jgi:uncharacterized protein YbdZ (MbtH family)
MAIGANVDPDALAAFRVALIKFQENCTAALGDAESDIQRHIMWLENDQYSYWSTQIRHRQEVLQRANEALRQKKLFKDSTGRTASAVEEQKAVTKAQMQLEEANQKMAATKQWSKRLQKELIMYKGQMQRFQTTVTSDVPAAVGHLGALIHALQEYAAAQGSREMEMPAELQAYFSAGGEGMMSRGKAGESVKKPFAHLRRRTPSAPSRVGVKTAAEAPKAWAAASVAESGLERMEIEFKPPAAAERVILARDAPAGTGIFLERVNGALPGDSGWFIGNLIEKETPTEAITVADLLAVRPDFEHFLALPAGWLVVIEESGIKAVLNDRNENIWPEPAAAEAAPAAAESAAKEA